MKLKRKYRIVYKQSTRSDNMFYYAEVRYKYLPIWFCIDYSFDEAEARKYMIRHKKRLSPKPEPKIIHEEEV